MATNTATDSVSTRAVAIGPVILLGAPGAGKGDCEIGDGRRLAFSAPRARHHDRLRAAVLIDEVDVRRKYAEGLGGGGVRVCEHDQPFLAA